MHLAFNSSLIVSYARPFHKSNEPEGLPRASLNPDVGVLEKSESALHAKVMSKRDQAVAHSDALSHEIEGFNYDSSSMKLYKSAFDPLTAEETRLLNRMIGKWIEHIETVKAATKQQQ